MKNKLKLAFAGTPDFSANILEILVNNSQIDLQFVLTNPDKKIGRKQKITKSPVKEKAENYQIPVFTPEKLKNIEDKFVDIDIFLVVAYSKIIPEIILNKLKFPLNIHGSLLPKYRGASPVQESIKRGDKKTGISLMKMVKKMDAGNYYIKHECEIKETDTTIDIFVKFEKILEKFLVKDLFDIYNEKLLENKQDEKKVTYTQKITKEDALVDFNKLTAQEIYNKLRAYTPWPYLYYYNKQGKRVKILSGEISKNKGIPTKKDFFLPLDIVIEGKKPSIWESF
jgi:methionyl-tRNA formyltransferase